MKTTIDLPDELMIEVKVMAARERRKLGELVTELVRTGIEYRLAQPPADAEERRSAEQWLNDWLKLADEVMADAPPGPTAREILAEGRNRLELR
jgi:hypothetical protein